jgi:hypothetical protein
LDKRVLLMRNIMFIQSMAERLFFHNLKKLPYKFIRNSVKLLMASQAFCDRLFWYLII